MDLDEFLWRQKISQKDFAAKIYQTECQVSSYVNRRRTPSLRIAIKIYEATKGIVDYKEMLNKKEQKIFNQKKSSKILTN